MKVAIKNAPKAPPQAKAQAEVKPAPKPAEAPPPPTPKVYRTVLATDHVYHPALPHIQQGKPSQDYALSGTDRTMAYAVVSDGCSRGRETDLGARILAHATRKGIGEWYNRCGGGVWEARNTELPTIVNTVQHMAMSQVKHTLGLSSDDLLATILYAVATENGAFLHVRGDGILALQKRDGTINVHMYDAYENRPMYPAYELDNYHAIANASGLNKPHGADESMGYTTWRLYKLNDADTPDLENPDSVATLSFAESQYGFTLFFTREELAELQSIAVFTDGIMQAKGMAWHEIIRAMLTFHGEGQVLVRSAKVLLRKLAAASGNLGDDLGCAVIRVVQQEVTPQP